MSSSYGEGLETGLYGTAPVLHPTAILQVDQAAPPDQEILWKFRERGEDANLDCDLNLRTRCHRQETAEPGEQSLHNSTDSERHPL